MVLNCRYLLSNIHAKLTLLLHVRSAEDAAGANVRPRPGLDRTASLSGSSRAARGEVRRTASLRRQQSATAAGKAPTEAKAKEKASTAVMDKNKTHEAKTSGASNTKDNTSAASASKAKTSAASAGKDKTPVPSSPKDPESVTFRSRTPRQPPAVPPKPRPANKVEDLKALAASATTSAPNTASPVAGAARRTVTKQSSTPQLQSKAGAGAGTQQSRAQKRSTGARKVEPSKEAAKEEGKTAKEAGRTVKEAVKPVMKKMAAKTSIAELARLADTQTREAGPGAGQPGQFVSHARATLSPAPARRQQQLRNIETVDTDTEDAEDTEPAAAAGEEESGIVSESVSASSVILMFGGTGRFKKSAAPQSPAPAPGRGRIVTNCEECQIDDIMYTVS